MLFRTPEDKSRRLQKEEITDAVIGLLQLRGYNDTSELRNQTEANRAMTKKKNNPQTSRSTVGDQKFAKAKPSLRDMQGQSRRTTKGRKNSLMPEISAAQHLLQLCVENSKSFDKDFIVTPNLKEEKENYLKSDCVGSMDKSCSFHDDEESKSDASHITDDQSDMETTLAEIDAAQQMMELSNSHHQQSSAEEEDKEEEEESSGYKSDGFSATSVVASTRNDFESHASLPRKRKFRSLAELYEITQPLEEPYFD